MSEYTLSQLKQLEAESIHIIRDAVSQFENPVMLYSIGKDSAVMVRLAQKAFYPGRIPFKLLHIDSTWKLREMLEFRDKFCKKNNLDLIVHHNKEGFKKGRRQKKIHKLSCGSNLFFTTLTFNERGGAT